MIGDKKLEMPKVTGDCWNIYKEFGFKKPDLPLDDSLFPNARRLVELNNEVYEKLNPPCCKTCKHDFDTTVYEELNGWPEICKTCKLGIGYKKNTSNYERKV